MQKVFFLSIFMLLTIAIGSAQNTQLRLKQFNIDGKLAIQGYDPVAYFTQNKAVKGSAAISTVYGGIQYNFATATNKEKFLATPAKYEPQYGGWCAYALGAKNAKVEIDPETFKIIDGKLYLFYNAYFNNTLSSWNKDEKTLLPKANANWNKIFKL